MSKCLKENFTLICNSDFFIKILKSRKIFESIEQSYSDTAAEKSWKIKFSTRFVKCAKQELH